MFLKCKVFKPSELTIFLPLLFPYQTVLLPLFYLNISMFISFTFFVPQSGGGKLITLDSPSEKQIKILLLLGICDF